MPDHGGDIQAWAKHWQREFARTLPLGHEGPGGAVYALQNGSELFSESFGMASVANRIPFDVATPCGVRSVTKVMTDALVLRAEQDSRAGLLAPFNGGVVDRELGEFDVISRNIGLWQSRYVPLPDRGPTGSYPLVHLNATLRQIASHNSHIFEIGKYPKVKKPTKKKPARTVYAATKNPADGWNNLPALKNIMESLGSVDEIVRQAGAVLAGVDAATFPRKPMNWNYYDKAGWLAGAVCEQLLGNSWYNLVQEQFQLLGASESCYPSYDGNIDGFYDSKAEQWKIFFKGHNANPVEIPGLAVAYSRYRGADGKQLFVEAESSTESSYAIGCAVMTAVDMARWAHNLRSKTDLQAGGYLTPGMRDLLFSVQTNAPDKNPDEITNADWPALNWGFGINKLKPVKTNAFSSGSAEQLDIWGAVGQGGFGGYGGAVVWLNDLDLVIAATSNTGILVRRVYAMAEDYAQNFG